MELCRDRPSIVFYPSFFQSYDFFFFFAKGISDQLWTEVHFRTCAVRGRVSPYLFIIDFQAIRQFPSKTDFSILSMFFMAQTIPK